MDDAESFNNLGVAYSDARQYGEAIVAYREAIRLNSQYFEAHYNLGAAYLSINKKDEAIRQYAMLKALHAGLAKDLYRLIYKDSLLTLTSK